MAGNHYAPLDTKHNDSSPDGSPRDLLPPLDPPLYWKELCSYLSNPHNSACTDDTGDIEDNTYVWSGAASVGTWCPDRLCGNNTSPGKPPNPGIKGVTREPYLYYDTCTCVPNGRCAFIKYSTSVNDVCKDWTYLHAGSDIYRTVYYNQVADHITQYKAVACEDPDIPFPPKIDGYSYSDPFSNYSNSCPECTQIEVSRVSCVLIYRCKSKHDACYHGDLENPNDPDGRWEEYGVECIELSNYGRLGVSILSPGTLNAKFVTLQITMPDQSREFDCDDGTIVRTKRNVLKAIIVSNPATGNYKTYQISPSDTGVYIVNIEMFRLADGTGSNVDITLEKEKLSEPKKKVHYKIIGNES